MLGRTNLLFVEGDNTSEIAFTPDYILTSTSGSIRKIEYINNLFFLFASDEVVLYGSDINSLQTLKNGDKIFKAKHIIFADGVYYMTKIEKTSGKAIIYKTADLISFEEITLKTGTSSYSYPVHGLFLNSKGEIVALIEEFISTSASSNRCQKFLLIVESLTDYQEESAKFIELGTSYYIYSLTATSTVMRKDRIFTSLYAGSSTSTTYYMITLDGTMRMQYDRHSYFAADYFFKTATNALYYSLNAIDYINLNFSDHVDKFNAINVFEYDGNIALIYRCTENDKTVTKLIVAATPKELPTAISSAIPVTIDYSMQYESNVYVDDYVYLGSDGGIVIKGKIDNVEVERPDVVVVKGMAAKEALKQANDYTDEKYKNITNEVELHEETTRQYMENAFSATPEGYAALVDTVSENKVKIDTIIEKADLSIKADASGEEIHLIDSAEEKAVEFALYGKAKQNTTSGKNLLENTATSQEKDGITFTVNEDKSVKCNGIASKNTTLTLNSKLILPLGTYKLSGGKENNARIEIKMLKTDGSYAYAGSKGTEGIFAITENIVSASSSIIIIEGTSLDNYTFYPMISVEGGEYEPFTNGASPNPQYPQPIEVSGASGSVEVKSCGKNLLKNIATTKTTNGGAITVNDDKSFTINGTFTTKTYFPIDYVSTVEDSVTDATKLVGKTLIASISETSHKGIYQSIGYFKKDGTYKALMAVETNKEVVYPTDAFKCRNFVAIDVGTYNNITVYPMIRLATDTDDTYEPYKETLATIPTENGLAGIKVSSNGNYTDQNGQQWICDEIVKYADGSGEKIQRVVKAVFDGSSDEKWILKTDIENPMIEVECRHQKIAGLCNLYTHASVTSANTNKGYSLTTYDARIRFRPDDYLTITLAEWKNRISENPITVVYVPEEPIRTPLTAEEIAEIEKLHTFYPVTNISNDADCGMSVKYMADSKNYIDRMVAEQVASIVVNMNK